MRCEEIVQSISGGVRIVIWNELTSALAWICKRPIACSYARAWRSGKAKDTKKIQPVRTSLTVRSMGLFWLVSCQSPNCGGRRKVNGQDRDDSLS